MIFTGFAFVSLLVLFSSGRLPQFLLYAFGFLDYFSFKYPLPRQDERGTVWAVSYILQTGHVAAASNVVNYESAGWPGLFTFAAFFQKVTGLSLEYMVESMRLFYPLALALVIALVIHTFFGKKWAFLSALALTGSFGITDIYSFTPLYFGMISVLTLTAIILRLTSGRQYVTVVLLFVITGAVALSHAFAPIFAVVITAVSLPALKGRIRTGTSVMVFLTMSVVLTVYDLYFVSEFGGFVRSGIQQGLLFLKGNLFSSQDLSAISAHVASVPWWSSLTVVIWLAATGLGTFISLIQFKQARKVIYPVIILGFLLSIAIVNAIQVGGESSFELDILSYVSAISIPVLAVFVTMKKPRHISFSGPLLVGTFVILALIASSSLFTYNSTVFSTTYQNTDVTANGFAYHYVSNSQIAYEIYPNSLRPLVFFPVVSVVPATIKDMLADLSKSRGAIVYINIPRTIASYSFYTGQSPSYTLSELQGLQNFSEIYSSGLTAIYYNA
ncbi:MAG: hypothetical protein JRN59_06590 [Nitrososphaerota archaeon]|nr:hypothetical protein [Nitrososphaerota archaeon]